MKTQVKLTKHIEVIDWLHIDHGKGTLRALHNMFQPAMILGPL